MFAPKFSLPCAADLGSKELDVLSPSDDAMTMYSQEHEWINNYTREGWERSKNEK